MFFLSPAAEADTAAAQRLGAAELPSLGAGKSRKVRFATPVPGEIPGGRYRLIVLVDGDEEIY